MNSPADLPAGSVAPGLLTKQPVSPLAASAGGSVKGMTDDMPHGTPSEPPPQESSQALSTESNRLPSQAVARLYGQHAEELRAFLLGVLGNLDLANEVLQNTFLKTVEQGHTAREDSVKGWLFRVAFNEAMTYRRRATVRHKAAAILREQPPEFAAAADEGVSLTEESAAVRSALETLPPELRQVVRLRIYHDLTFAAIASELHLPLGTVYARLHLALKKLKSLLGEEFAC